MIKMKRISTCFISLILVLTVILTTSVVSVFPQISVLAQENVVSSQAETEDLTQFVNPRYGVDGAGGCVIGPARPNGSVNPSPDTKNGGNSGYASGNAIRGFSQIHASGTGYGKYGEFLISPQIGLKTGHTEHDSKRSGETPTCYEYKVTLTDYDIDCAFTPAEHSTIYKFTYPESTDASILIDMAHSVPLLANLVGATSGISASKIKLEINTDTAGQTIFSGSGNYAGGFGKEHDLYFYAIVNKQAENVGVYDVNGLQDGVKTLDKPTLSNKTESAGGYMQFETLADEDIYMKIGVSFTSVDVAKKWLEEEIPAWDYEAIKEETKNLWNQELNKIKISGTNLSDDEKKKFYTSFYHSMIMPRDRTNDIPGYGEDAAMIDDHYAGWDTWRSVYPFYALVKPEMVTKTVNSFIARYEKNGYVRDTFVGGVDMVQQQGGDDVDNIIADAYVKGIEGIDWDKAYEVVKNHADNYRLGYLGSSPAPNKDAPYRTYGYIPNDYITPGTSETARMSASYTLEQAYNDYCAAILAKDLGTAQDYETYLARSNNWTNLWNPNAVYEDYNGFIMPKNMDGSWVDIDITTRWGSWVKYFYEGSSYNYSFFVPHDVEQLIEKCGGEEAFVDRLLHGINTGLVDYGNEPAFLAPYLFAYTSKPFYTTDSVQKLRASFTSTGPSGNDDSGAMSTWYMFSSMGFFPNAGQNLYYFTSPCYENTEITLANGNKIVLKANNLSEENKYIQSIKLNGEPYRSTMFTHDDIKNGAVFEFEMGNEPVNYAKQPEKSVKIALEDAADEVNLDNYDEWAHFGKGDININRNADSEKIIAPNGLSALTAKYFYTETLSTGPVFLWTNGSPDKSSADNRDIVWNEDGMEFDLYIPQGAFDVEVYVSGIRAKSKVEVYNEKGEKSGELDILDKVYTRDFKKILLEFDCEEAGMFTVKLITQPDETSNDYSVGLSAITVKQIPLHTVSFDTLGGNVIYPIQLREGEKIENAQTPLRSGYEFIGWYTDDQCITPWNFDTDTVNVDITLYAKWNQLAEFEISSVSAVSAAYPTVNLSKFADWVHYGRADSGIGEDRKNIQEDEQIFGKMTPGSGSKNREGRTDLLYTFEWDDGTPTSSKEVTGTEEYYWSGTSLTLPVTIPYGKWDITLYAVGLRARTTASIVGDDGVVIVPAVQLTKNTTSRSHVKVNVSVNNTSVKPQSVNIVLETDLTQAGEYCSVGLFAATASRQMGEVKSISVSEVPYSTEIDLDVFDDWSHFNGTNVTTPDRKADVTTSIIGGLSATNGKMYPKDFATSATETLIAPYLKWTGGAPTASATEDKKMVWGAEGLEVAVNIPNGIYDVTIYATGIRSRGLAEVLDANKNVLIAETELWKNGGNTSTRSFSKVDVRFEARGTSETFIIRLKTDPDNRHTADFSVGVSAAGAKFVSEVDDAVIVKSKKSDIEGNTVQYATEIVNFTENRQDCIVILAVYDDEGNLIDAVAEQQNIGKQGFGAYVVSTLDNLPENAKTSKVFVWNKNLVPFNVELTE